MLIFLFGFFITALARVQFPDVYLEEQMSDLDLTQETFAFRPIPFKDLRIITVDSRERLAALEKSIDLPLLLGVFEEGSRAAIRLDQLATELRDHALVIIAVGTLPKQLGLEDEDLIFIPRQRNGQIQYEGELTHDALLAFLEEQKPIIDEICPDNFQSYITQEKPLLYILLDPSVEEQKEIIKTLEPFATTFKDHLSVAWLDITKWSSRAFDNGLPVDDLPRIALETTSGRKYWAPVGTKTLNQANNFLHDFVSGTLKPYDPHDHKKSGGVSATEEGRYQPRSHPLHPSYLLHEALTKRKPTTDGDELISD
eukprot:gb/GEZN01011828.1/.p1 GENE.gb/GEZN01011828.1/~~gb/GEZN01011828.1/.p1  ORF type:complete len:312 (-),score=35.41 gb/GEZN01011828.1/:146-1081(-)